MNYPSLYQGYCLHSTWTQLDDVTHLGQQDTSKCDTSKGLKSAGNFDYPLLLAAFKRQLQCEKAQAVKYEVRPGTCAPCKMAASGRTSQFTTDVPVLIPWYINFH